MKKLLFTLLLLISISVSPTTFAAENCPPVIYWDGVELTTGQIGRVIIQQPTNIYINKNGTFEVARQVKPSENFRVYVHKGDYFHLGGGLVIQNDASVLFQTPSKEKLQLRQCIKNPSTAFSIGNTASSVTKKLGNPKMKVLNEFNASTSIYHQTYQHFYAISYLNNKIASLYTTDQNYQFDGISVNDTIRQLENKLGKQYRITGNTYPVEIITYSFPAYEASFFIDVHADNKIAAILLQDYDLLARNPNLYPKQSSNLAKNYETLLFELTNAKRKSLGISTLQYATNISNVARKHSVDMGINDYFNHDNLKGESPYDRLALGGILFRNAGENIAMGYTNPYFAHEALMNSLGHRNNILSTNYSQLGVGVYFAKWTYGSIPYYTENFINH